MSKRTEFKERLVFLMEEISEECYAASWNDGLEYFLWRIVLDNKARGRKARKLGRSKVTREHIGELKSLSKKARGWFIWNEGEECSRFVPTEIWEKMFRDYESGR